MSKNKKHESDAQALANILFGAGVMFILIWMREMTR